MIVQHDDNIVHRQKAAQERVFRLSARDHGLTLKAIPPAYTRFIGNAILASLNAERIAA